MLVQERFPHTEAQAPPRPNRLHALDAVRGLAIVVMLLVMNPGPTGDLPGQLRHAGWHGLTIADLAFPLFLFAVGASMTLSSRGLDTGHVLTRTAALAVLGVALATHKHQSPTATGVLQHIAGAYLLAFIVMRAPRRYLVPLAAGILVVLWAGFVAWAAPHADPWGESGTLAHAVDGRVLGDISTEGILPTVASAVTVLGGAHAGLTIRSQQPDRRALTRRLGEIAVGLLALGGTLSLVVPVSKRLWTPSFTVLTLGVSFALLAAAVWVLDVRGIRRATTPLVHLGANPMVIYLVSMTILFTLRNQGFVASDGPTLVALGAAVGWISLWWLLALGLYRRRLFVKI